MRKHLYTIPGDNRQITSLVLSDADFDLFCDGVAALDFKDIPKDKLIASCESMRLTRFLPQMRKGPTTAPIFEKYEIKTETATVCAESFYDESLPTLKDSLSVEEIEKEFEKLTNEDKGAVVNGVDEIISAIAANEDPTLKLLKIISPLYKKKDLPKQIKFRMHEDAVQSLISTYQMFATYFANPLEQDIFKSYLKRLIVGSIVFGESLNAMWTDQKLSMKENK